MEKGLDLYTLGSISGPETAALITADLAFGTAYTTELPINTRAFAFLQKEC